METTKVIAVLVAVAILGVGTLYVVYDFLSEEKSEIVAVASFVLPDEKKCVFFEIRSSNYEHAIGNCQYSEWDFTTGDLTLSVHGKCEFIEGDTKGATYSFHLFYPSIEAGLSGNLHFGRVGEDIPLATVYFDDGRSSTGMGWRFR